MAMDEIYAQLAKFLDDLPAGYPPTESGLELRILRKLFTPEEAALFMHLSLIGETARVAAYRAHLPMEQVVDRLDEMEKKGLIAGNHRPGHSPEYSVNQFVVGFLEEQVDHVDAELAELLDPYLPVFFDKNGPWTALPQMRTVPVGVSIPITTDVLPYERADAIVRTHTYFAVRNCVCRQERQVVHKGCDKPMETCLSFDNGARQAVEIGRARPISMDDALAILQQADQAGLVLQPANSQDPIFICACCGCCCGVLRNLKMHEKPANLVANPFIARQDADLCSGCETCIERCQMGALTFNEINGLAELNPDRCIGCGLCVSTCPSGALSLVRKSPADQPAIPKNTLSTYLQLGRARGKFGNIKLVSMLVKSGVDRLVAPRK